ncbi:MAG: FAD-binding oxidoreductase [Planctomycetes bacterium]|nr:FAD-binding oxidoreductase [Planctomycetota bacterium]
MTESPHSEHHVLSGWGESVHGWARVWKPRGTAETAALLRRFADGGRTATLRGAGRSYGDAALSAAGDVIDLTALSKVRSFDAESGIAEVEGGVTIEDLWRSFLPLGWWPKVVPGTMRPTVAGAISMNIHGKNHWKHGGFGESVEEIELALTTGEIRRVSAAAEPDLFRAVTGGLGLLGAVTSARIRLHRVHSGRLSVSAFPTRTLSEMYEQFERRADASDYMVGWVDCFDGAARGVMHTARYLGPGEDADAAATLTVARQDLPAKLFGVLHRSLVAPMMKPAARPAGMRAINALKYRSAAVRGEHTFLQEHVRFAFLLDYVPGWKSIYAPGGLLQYQTFLPRESAAQVHTELLRRCRERRIVPWLGVTKKHRACPSVLPHALDGYSFAMDFPVTAGGRDALLAHCRDMDDVVVAAGGRVYFAKDQTTTPATVRRVFPRIPEFLEWKRSLDPAGVLTSDLAVRAGIVV